MKKVRIVLGDLSYHNRHTRRTGLIPLNIGYIASYVAKKFAGSVDLILHKDPKAFLDDIKNEEPSIIGLSFYYWNTNLNKEITAVVRSLYGSGPVIVWGGPSVDSNESEQALLFKRFPGVDAYVVNEGELGFAAVVEAVLSNRESIWKAPLDGVVFDANNDLVVGRNVGLSMDLSELPSPFLNGYMDPFLNGDYLPLLQTSRLCPYQCSFCVSGKNTGKLRAFENDVVKEEMEYLFNHFKGKDHYRLYIADENFGILSRDIEIAEHLLWCSKEIGYPKAISFYNDKRFTDTSKHLQEILAPICTDGVTLSLQTDNPDSMKAVHRTNLTKEQVKSAIQWSSERDFHITTELIFGLPMETRNSFVATLNDNVAIGFDSIVCNNLFIVDGIELHRPEERKKYGIETKFRPLSTNYGNIGGRFCYETEEVVVSTDSFDFSDFLEIRWLSLFFSTIFHIGWYRDFFQFVRGSGIPVADFLLAFIGSNPQQQRQADHTLFITKFETAVKGELFSSEQDVGNHLNKVFLKNNKDVAKPARHNVYFGARLCYMECDWVATALWDTFLLMAKPEVDLKVAKALINIGSVERVDLFNPEKPVSIPINFDIVKWRRDKYRNSIKYYGLNTVMLEFFLKPSLESKRRDLVKDFGSILERDEFYYTAVDFINPRSDLLFGLKTGGKRDLRLQPTVHASGFI
jgi:radical SAM superfamily enzyme YgiQ (UPF0313 family)